LQEACGPACQLGSASSVGGYNHQCALTFDGSVECWGSTVPNGLVAKQIAVGVTHSCALKIDGAVKCWRSSNYVETTVPNGLVAKQIALGLDHACAIKLDDTLKCWGGLPKGSPSQLIVKRVALGNEVTVLFNLKAQA
jgi:alpha-tubulin suppressor-like RCC1 family protein